MFTIDAAPLPAEPAAVLAVLAAAGAQAAVRLNELAARTGLPTGHIGRHLRTLERDRLARYAAGGWHITVRGTRLVAASTPSAAAA
jgi:DNA-binding IclR family transcriptional regulator